METFKLLFASSVFNRNRKGTNFFFRQNYFASFYMILMMIGVPATTYNLYKARSEDKLVWVYFIISILMFVGVYKVIVGVIRVLSKKIPVWGSKSITKSDRRYKTGQRTIGSVTAVIGRTDLTQEELALHKRQQLHRLIFWIVICFSCYLTMYMLTT